jgi:hypothetical protein
MARIRISTTVDEQLLKTARRTRSELADAALIDEALSAHLAGIALVRSTLPMRLTIVCRSTGRTSGETSPRSGIDILNSPLTNEGLSGPFVPNFVPNPVCREL